MEIENSNQGFILFIEPKNHAQPPVIDMYTQKITGAFRSAKDGASGYGIGLPHFVADLGTKGWHTCGCEHAHSSNKDYLLGTDEPGAKVSIFPDTKSFFNGKVDAAQVSQGMVITNSLCIHYVACHRDEISAETLERILLLKGDPAYPTPEELMS